MLHTLSRINCLLIKEVLSTSTRCLAISAAHNGPNKNYDKKIKLLPPEVAYHPKDPRFLKGPTPYDQPYVKLDQEEIVSLEKLDIKTIAGGRWNSSAPREEAKWDEPPFNEILEGVPCDRFTQVEVVRDPGVWFWVERLLPKATPPPPKEEIGATGWVPQPKTKPNLPYYVPRTRSHLFPVYKQTIIHGPLTQTMVQNISGNVWQFEKDVRDYLEEKHGQKMMTSVNEASGKLRIKGDYCNDVVKWLTDNGF